MSTTNDIPNLERPAFFSGQRLAAGDLTNLQDYHRELRWLHNRSMHNWGIAFGLEVTGKKGDRSVHIRPGYALDCVGRDLILPEEASLALPAISAAGGPKVYYLTASYQPDESVAPSDTRAGVCEGSGAVRRPEALLLRWMDPQKNYTVGVDIVLASVQVENCRLAAPISATERRKAQPASEPYIAAGQTLSSATNWTEFFLNGLNDGSTPDGVMVEVDTSAAGFGATPHYSAHVVGPRWINPNDFSFDPALLAGRPIALEGFVSIAGATSTSFVLQLHMPRNMEFSTARINPDFVFNTGVLKVVSLLNWYVVWMGVEGSGA